ncbi:unnamed protein product [Rotaria sp. Silwood1]|nr:unnamed protein product [Rotaria sp. Silwood1]
MLNNDDCDLVLVSSSSPSRKSLIDTSSNEYFVVENNRNLSSDIWQKFGFPARKRDQKSDKHDQNSDKHDQNSDKHDQNLDKHDQNSDKHDIIPNFTSCFKCLQRYRFTNATTSSMREHKCPQENLKGQKQLNYFISPSSSPSRSTIVSKTIKQKKENIKRLFVRWIVTGIRPFQIVSDSGRELHLEKLQAQELLCSDRTVRNELFKQANTERTELQDLLVNCAQSGRLSISPDIWTDNYRKIAYLGATAHMVDDNYKYYSIDLFCIEFKNKKTGDNIVKLIREQLSIYTIDSFMDLITFVTDRGSNFIKGLHEFRLMFCVAHRLNGILKKTFFQISVAEKKSPMKTTSIISSDTTPTKITAYLPQLSPEIAFNDEQYDEEEKAALEQWNKEEEDDDDDVIDYSIVSLTNIPWSAREILETIQQCKILVQYIKKSNLNRQIQLLDELDHENEQQHSPFTTIHQCSTIRWLSMCDLLDSIKKSYEPLKRILTESKQLHRLEKINMGIIEQLIDFFRPWQNVVKEVQTGNMPSLHVVFPCINYLQDELRKFERGDKPGMKFFAKRSLSLLNSMFHMEDEYILASFLHPKFKGLLSATAAQKAECYHACRALLPKESVTTTFDTEYEPPKKKVKTFSRTIDG